ncbi:flagellar hook-associated protein FlgK [Ensifer soli]|uniref:flagellar hook-associated protein FlgK n=1 Tax=Ciceribacter sp. sgz301302 TaxID=3342379 RepID=UPI0035B8341A
MSLSSAITTAQQIFNNTSIQTTLVSKNIANSGNADYSRRLALLGSSANGATVVSIQRAQSDALMKQTLASISQASAQDRLLSGLQAIKTSLGDNDYETSPATYLSSFRDTLQTYAATPASTTVAASVVAEARDLALSISKTSAAVQDVRLQADKDIGNDVAELNRLLSEFEKVNNRIKGMTVSGADTSDAMDDREKLLKQMSEIVGISTVGRANNDTVIYTSDGIVLFETTPRQVSFSPTVAFNAATTGGAVYVDGVELSSGTGGNTSAQGRLQSLLQVRDDIAPTFQTQLDELARGLVTLFQEGGAPGLFVWAGGTIPAPGTLVSGMAETLSVNPLAESNPQLLRDGGFNGVVSNTGANSGYSALLDSFVAALDAPMTFDGITELQTTGSITDFAGASLGWIEQLRSTASAANDTKSALLSRTQQALSNETGVSIDEELSLLLDLEQSYKASAKLVTTVDAMFRALMDAV